MQCTRRFSEYTKRSELRSLLSVLGGALSILGGVRSGVLSALCVIRGVLGVLRSVIGGVLSVLGIILTTKRCTNNCTLDRMPSVQPVSDHDDLVLEAVMGEQVLLVQTCTTQM